MKKLILASSLAMALAAPAMASETAEGVLSLEGSVAQTCYVASDPSGSITSGGTGSVTTSGGAPTDATSVTASWDSASIINPTTAAAAWGDYNGANFDVNTARAVINFNAVCNFASSSVSLTSANAGLRNLGAPPSVGDFADAISYSVRARWNGDGVGTAKFGPSNPGNGGGTLVMAPGGSVTNAVALPTNAPMNLTIRFRKAHKAGSGAPVESGERADFPLLAGTYSDTLTVRFGANP
jgi:hypothetical protein